MNEKLISDRSSIRQGVWEIRPVNEGRSEKKDMSEVMQANAACGFKYYSMGHITHSSMWLWLYPAAYFAWLDIESANCLFFKENIFNYRCYYNCLESFTYLMRNPVYYRYEHRCTEQIR